eukprot:6096532-Prymnesium_polylepis.1
MWLSSVVCARDGSTRRRRRARVRARRTWRMRRRSRNYLAGTKEAGEHRHGDTRVGGRHGDARVLEFAQFVHALGSVHVAITKIGDLLTGRCCRQRRYRVATRAL